MNQEAKPGEVLLVNKPYGWTSFQAVKKVKWVVKAKKAGHAGTLDPLATGLLIICTERSTKKINAIQDAEKEYEGTIFFGATTPSYDLETEVNETYPWQHITSELLHSLIPQFSGEIQQAPPLFSAIKVEGKRAYTLARKGETQELGTRTIQIRELEFTRVELPEVDFRVVCSKGTYIRSLAFDLGKAAGSGAYLKRLVRTRIGGYLLSNARTPAEIQEAYQRPGNDLPVKGVLTASERNAARETEPNKGEN